MKGISKTKSPKAGLSKTDNPKKSKKREKKTVQETPVESFDSNEGYGGWGHY